MKFKLLAKLYFDRGNLLKIGQVLAVLPFSAFALYVFFSAFSKSDLFVGWDTPAYVYSVRILEREGFLSFLRFFEYHRFPYPLILYLLHLPWPQGLFVLVRILPTLLAFLATFLVGLVLLRWFRDSALAIFGIIFSFVWIAPYILASNLYSQLFSLVLGLLWLTYSFRPQTKRVQALAYTIFLIASISHVYTMIFLFLAYFLSNATIWVCHFRRGVHGNYRKTIVNWTILGAFLAAPLIASTVFMGSTRIFGPLLNQEQMVETITRPVSNSLMCISFGGNAIFIIPFAFLVTLQCIRKSQITSEKLRYLFILWWTVIALAMPVFSYVFPYLVSYAERMIIITPIPILLALFARKLSSYVNGYIANLKVQSAKLGRAIRSNWFKRAVVSTTVLLIFIINVNPILDSSRTYLVSFVPQDLDIRLSSMSQNMQFGEKPLFIIDTSDTLIADYGELWDSIIGAYLGPHYTYIGPMQNLAHLRRTFFSSARSDICSNNFFNKLNQSGILSYDNLTNRSIILLDDLYSLREYEMPYVSNVEEGIYLVDFGKLWMNKSLLTEKIVIEAYADSAERIGPWYGIKREWSSSYYVLELYSNVSVNEVVSYRFYVYEGGIFSAKARYFDFAGYEVPLELRIDGGLVGYIRYGGSQSPQVVESSEFLLLNGWHELSIRPGSKGPLVVDLDYFLLEQQSSRI